MKSTGEQLMCDFLDIFLENQKYLDNYRPDWLTNPATGQPLEMDRYYPRFKVGYEFQGEYHLRQLSGFGDIEYTRYLDRLKKQLAFLNNVEIIAIEPIDLMIHPMFHKSVRCYSHLEKISGLKGIRKRHKRNLSSLINSKKIKELSQRAAEYRQYLKETYGDQLGIHKRQSVIRKELMSENLPK